MIEWITSVATDKSKDCVNCEICQERADFVVSMNIILFTFCEECLVSHLNNLIKGGK